MSAPGGAPSPGPRGGSMGPNANGTGMGMPSQGSLPGTPVHSAPTPGPSAPPSGAMSQQNLNQIVSSARRPSFPLCDVLFYPCPLCPIFALRFFSFHTVGICPSCAGLICALSPMKTTMDLKVTSFNRLAVTCNLRQRGGFDQGRQRD